MAPEGRKVGSLQRRVRSHLARWEMKNCTPLWRKAYFQVKMLKTPHVRTTFGRSDVVSRGRRKGLCTLSKASKKWPFSSISKNDGKRGTFEEDLERRISRGRRNTKDMFIRDVRRSGPLMHKSYGLSKGGWIFLQKCWLTPNNPSALRSLWYSCMIMDGTLSSQNLFAHECMVSRVLARSDM